MKHHLRTAIIGLFAFALGFALARTTLVARADAPALQPAAIDLTAITPDSMPTPGTTTPNLRSKTLVVTDGMTAAVQMGTVAKHYHANANEVQIILQGSGTEWLGDKQVALKPGMMIVIPENTNHAGFVATGGPFEIVSFKTPPQAPSDVQFVP